MPRKTGDFFCYKTVCFDCFSHERRSFDSPGGHESPEPWLGHLTALSQLPAQEAACLPSVRRGSTRPIRRACSSGVGHFCAHRIGECVNRCVHLRTTRRAPRKRGAVVSGAIRAGIQEAFVSDTRRQQAPTRAAAHLRRAQDRGFSVVAAGDPSSTGSAAARDQFGKWDNHSRNTASGKGSLIWNPCTRSQPSSCNCRRTPASSTPSAITLHSRL